MPATSSGHGLAGVACLSAASLLRRLLLLGSCLQPLSSALRSSAGAHLNRSSGTSSLRQYTFRDFVRQFGRSYQPGTQEWRHREKTFNWRMQQVHEHNTGPWKSWTMGVTKFMDFTESEFKALLGYKGRRKSHPHSSSSLLSVRDQRKGPVPAYVNTLRAGTRLPSVVYDQGACGSCWATAAVTVLEAQLEGNKTLMWTLRSKARARGKKVVLPTLSTQTLVSCVKNPRHCGGFGQCDGATAELAYALVKERGMPLAQDWQYKSAGGKAPECQEDVFRKGPLIGISGWTVLPSNEALSVKQALVDTRGPIVVTAAASGWANYEKGIYTEPLERRDFTVNHAVVMVGYKEPRPERGELGYWVIKNSWGEDWGERGYVRVEMTANEDENCGWDHSPQEGITCDGGPEKVWVCGMNGLLYDSVYPTGIYIRG